MKLKPCKSFIYHGLMKYLVVYDAYAPKKQRYTVMVLNVEDPVIVGAGLPKRSCLEVIAEYEVEIQRVKKDTAWYGDRTNVLDCIDAVTCRRRQENVNPENVKVTYTVNEHLRSQGGAYTTCTSSGPPEIGKIGGYSLDGLPL